MKPFVETISEKVWQTKYRYQHPSLGFEKSLQQTWDRVATAAASAEKSSERKYWQQQFSDVLQNFRFLPGGRILAGAGTQHQVTLFNCFVMGIIEDSMPGIFTALQQGAITLQQGGGIGYDFSTLRPSGVVTKHTHSIASGPVSFMDLWDSMSAITQSTGARRGAMMATLRCDHPDIEMFIAAKADPAKLRHFNVSVLITNDFMYAVKHNQDWPLLFPAAKLKHLIDRQSVIMQRQWSGVQKPVDCLVFKWIKARKLWQQIMSAAYDYAEPGVLFIDHINAANTLYYSEQISATNPCGEIPLPAYGACNLGSLNLTQYILQPWQQRADLDWDRLIADAKIATRFLDNIIQISDYPLPKQQHQALHTRRIGLGITGLADAFVMLGVRYNSQAAITLTHSILSTLMQATWQASIELARDKKSCPAFEAKNYLKGVFVKSLPLNLRRDIKRYGIRNSHHNTIAPTGSISLLANNVSSGIEPIFADHYQRRIRGHDNRIETLTIKDYAYREWQQQGKPGRPPAWIDAQQLKPQDHLNIMAAVQPYVDNAVSKTIFIPPKTSRRAFANVYQKAYDLELKGCTVFRPNAITGSVLTSGSVEEHNSHCCHYTIDP